MLKSFLQLPSFLFPTHQSRKRCATHVYITHFIDCQRHMKSNPLWAASYGSSTGLYGNGLVGTSASTALAPRGRSHELPSTCLKDKGNADVNSIPANVNGAKNRESNACMDALEIKSNSQQQTQPSQKKSPIFQVWWKFKLKYNGLLTNNKLHRCNISFSSAEWIYFQSAFYWCNFCQWQ